MKNLRKIGSFLLIFALIVSQLAFISAFADAESDELKKRLDGVILSYPSGSRWNDSFDGAVSCFGFGKLVINRLFGNDSDGNIRTWDYSGQNLKGMVLVDKISGCSPEDIKALLSKALPGDILQLEPASKNQHTMIVYSVSPESWTVYDCNWDGAGAIRLEEVGYSFFSFWNGAPLSLLRAADMSAAGAPDVIPEDEEADSVSDSEENLVVIAPNPSGGEASEDSTPADGEAPTDVLAPAPVFCEVSFDPNGGENAPDAVNAPLKNGVVTVCFPAAGPVREGYIFEGWQLFDNPVFDICLPGTEISYIWGDNSPLCFYAQWKEDKGSFDNFKENDAYDGRFEDVSESNWFYANVQTAYNYGLMKGDSEKTFSPTGDVSIAQAITMAARIHSIFSMGEDSFVQTGDKWYGVYVDYAKKNSIIRNDFDDYNRPAKRSEFAGILAAALPERALNALNEASFDDIPDVSGEEDFAGAVLALYRAGILTGSDSSRSFMPESGISRAEAAAIITRMALCPLRITFSDETD